MTYTSEGRFTPFPRPILVTITSNETIAREGHADTDAPARAIWKAGRRVWCKGTVTGEAVEGNNVWLITGKGEQRDLLWRVWSGATDFDVRRLTESEDTP